MKRFLNRKFFEALVIGMLGSSMVASLGQVSSQDTTLRTFQNEQRALAQEEDALITQGATSQQLQVWHQKNAARVAVQLQRAQALSAKSALQSLPAGEQLWLPANISAAMRDFLSTQVALANAWTKTHNQLAQTTIGQNLTPAQISQLEQSELQQFQRQYASTIKLQAQRAQTLAQESAQIPLPAQQPHWLPSALTPQMAAYLTALDQLSQEETQMRNQYISATPAAREAAMQQWLKQNASRIQQLQQQTQ